MSCNVIRNLDTSWNCLDYLMNILQNLYNLRQDNNLLHDLLKDMWNLNNFLNGREDRYFLLLESLDNFEFCSHKVLCLYNFNQSLDFHNLISEDIYSSNLVSSLLHLNDLLAISLNCFDNFLSEWNGDDLLNECLDNIVHLDKLRD